MSSRKSTASSAGSEYDVAVWVEKYSDDLFSWALHKTSDQEVAEDLVQDTFLQAFQSLSRFEGRSSPKTWLFSILNNKIIDHYRRKDKTPFQNPQNTKGSAEDGYFDANGSWLKEAAPVNWEVDDRHLLDDIDFRKVLQDCLDRLPTLWQNCILLKYLSGNGGQEICEALAISPSNYWQILHRSKLQLRSCLEVYWFNA